MKRKFNEVEKKLSKKNLIVMNEELSHLNFLFEYNSLMVNRGLESNFKEKMREYRKGLKILEGEIKEKTASINVLDDQIKNGVEIIEKKRPSGVG